MAGRRRKEWRQLGTRVDADLYEWLRVQGDRLPPVKGQGKRPDDRRSDYVRKVLEDHRRGGGYTGEILDERERAGLETYRNLIKTDPSALQAMFKLTGLAQEVSPDVGVVVEVLARILTAAYGLGDPLAPGSFAKPTSTARKGR